MTLLFLLLWAAPPAGAQTTALDWLTIDVWPDYDRRAVLVLVTGSVVPETTFPAEVTIPFPAGADLNAVARISDENAMIDDIDYTTEDGAVTLTTPDPRFRVEYYLPYEADGLDRSFTLTWQADVAANTFDVTVQQPAAATDLAIDPAADIITEGSDGLQYYGLEVGALPAGERFSLQVNYTMGEDQLTTVALPPPETSGAANTGAGPDTAATADGAGSGFNWPLVLAVAGGLLVVVALTWQFYGDRLSPSRQRVRKPRPNRVRAQPESGAGGGARFCHNCGERLQSGDRFCRNCGTAVKGR